MLIGLQARLVRIMLTVPAVRENRLDRELTRPESSVFPVGAGAAQATDPRRVAIKMEECILS